MRSIIIGTAGHIDHGKTALIKALTGIDADRLEEEKRRGITIDIGFAHLELPSEGGEIVRIGFIDVPGHERFVRNMLAGIGGIDAVLLIISADESIRPQTREHFDICRLLSVKRGITVLTKSDLIDAETLEVVRLEVGDFVRGSFLDTSRSPIIAVSALTGAGTTELKNEIAKLALQVETRDPEALPRLPIDRVFTMKGFGTVVTGTLISGTIRSEDELELSPGGDCVRVRGMHVHGQPVAQSTAGQRTALNLTGVNLEKLQRGMILSPPKTFEAGNRFDLSMSLTSSSKPLKHRTRVHFHCHTMESVAEVSLHETKELAAGEDAFAQVKLAQSALLLPGDRFILRQLSPATTIGGGVVLDNSPPMRAAKMRGRTEFLGILKTGSTADVLEARIARQSTRGISLTQLVAQTGLRAQKIGALVSGNPRITQLRDIYISDPAKKEISEAIVSSLAAFHKTNALVAGMNKEELRGHLPSHHPSVYEALLQELSEARRIEFAGDLVHLPGLGVRLKEDEAQSKKVIENAFSSAGLEVPALKDVLAGLQVDKVRAQKIVTLLLQDKTLIKISNDLVFHTSALQSLRQNIAAEKNKSAKIDVTRFKAITGVSRKYAIPLLEYLDREHVTRRVGNERIIL